MKQKLDIDLSGDLTFTSRKGDRRQTKSKVRGEFYVREHGDRTIFGKDRRKKRDRRDVLIDTSFARISEISGETKKRGLY